MDKSVDSSLGYATTPPLPSSSPAPMVENMEISPLPHKGRFVSQVEITSPTPIASPASPADEDMVLDSPAPIPRQPSLEPKAESVSIYIPVKTVIRLTLLPVARSPLLVVLHSAG